MLHTLRPEMSLPVAKFLPIGTLFPMECPYVSYVSYTCPYRKGQTFGPKNTPHTLEPRSYCGASSTRARTTRRRRARRTSWSPHASGSAIPHGW